MHTTTLWVVAVFSTTTMCPACAPGKPSSLVGVGVRQHESGLDDLDGPGVSPYIAVGA
ncbi:hypothetical protein [Streptomyces sp. PRh5]|uniref:hypothetical protein n=1 Tax=Streptomyces sp. PRh5 TaxID=1158056 RepID=UPI0004BA7671|nr:hypothetical protein [Streptomyces sp. PRh5]